MKNKYVGFIFAILANFICFSAFFISHNDNLLFFLLWIICILIIFSSRISLFSSISFIISYISVPVFFQENFNHSYGMLELNYIPLYVTEIYILIIFGLDLLLLFVYLTKIVEREKRLYKYNFKVPNAVFYLSCIGSALFSIVAFPRLPFVETTGDRFAMLLPGHAWNHLSLVFLIICTTRIKKSNLAKFSVFFTIFWFLSHGERVDMLGYFLGIFIYYFNSRKVKFKKIVIALILGFVVVVGFNAIGSIRMNQSNSFSSVIYNLLVQKTAADIAYVFNSSIHFTHTNNLYNGLTYSSYFLNLIPFADVPYIPENILRETYNTAGGEFIYCEPMMNFGVFGFALFEFIELSTLNFLFSKSKIKYIRYVLIFVVFTQFRIIWYGRTYIMTSLFLFIPCLMIISMFFYNKNKMVYKIIDNI